MKALLLFLILTVTLRPTCSFIKPSFEAMRRSKYVRFLEPLRDSMDPVLFDFQFRQQIISTISFFATFAVAFRSGAALSVINQVRVRVSGRVRVRVTVNVRVGVKERTTTIHQSYPNSNTNTNSDPYQPQKPSVPSGKFKDIGVRIAQFKGFRGKIFYPAVSNSQGIEAAYCTDFRETSDGMAGLVGFKHLGLSFLLAHLATAGSGAIKDAKPNTDASLPMLVYSHGYGGNMDMATYFLREIASHGIIVVG
jgi:hypothetical protein